VKNAKALSLPVVMVSGIVLSLLSLFVFIGLQLMTQRFSPTVANAERYLRKGKIDEAFTLADKMKPGSAARELLRGKLFLARSLKLRKTDGWRSYGTDSADWLQGADADSALACFDAVLALEKQSSSGWYFKGVVAKEKGWLAEAEDAFHEALRFDPGSVVALLALGSLYTQMNRVEAAAAILHEAYKLAPDNPQVSKNTAYLYRFYIDNPESAAVWFNRYLNTAQTGDIDINRAKTEYENILARYPEYRPKEPQLWRENRRKFFPRK
jgi:tetratricopeptide (TPR) repeat protein